MAALATCAACGLSHDREPDGQCPRCHGRRADRRGSASRLRIAAAAPARRPPAPRPLPFKALAIASLAVATFGMCLSLGGVVPLIAVAIGVVALNRVSRDPQRYAGRRVALTGSFLGGIGVLIHAPIWAVAVFATR